MGAVKYMKHPFFKTLLGFGYGHKKTIKTAELMGGLGFSFLSPVLYLLGRILL